MKSWKFRGSPWPARLGYLLFLALPVLLLKRELAATKFPGGFIYPPHFQLFSSLFHYQEALFVGLIFAVVAIFAARVSAWWLRLAVFLPFTLWFVWLMLWAFVRNAFKIQLSPWYAWDIVRHPSAVAGVGINPSTFYAQISGLLAIALVMALAGGGVVRQLSARFINRMAIFSFCTFLTIHIPVRAYLVYQVNRGEHVIMQLDDWTPIPLRTEFLVPGLRLRLSLPNLENPKLTQAYVEWIKHLPVHEIPHKIDIMWIVIESFRADAIAEKTTPYLWNHRDEFQLKLNQNHWSGGNASQFGLFSMFTGVSGYHLQTFIRGGAYVPLFRLLEQNNYRIRIANRHYFEESGKFRSFLPPLLNGPEIEGPTEIVDARMIDMLLADMHSRSETPSLDIVPFDSTHWPFYFPSEDRVFEVAQDKLPKNVHVTKTRAQVEDARNRFRNASHFVDRQIARIIEPLRARGALDHTVVIIAGDHGEEFMERGQVFHGGALDDFQGRPVLWIHFPDRSVAPIEGDKFTSHTDLVPTLLDCLGFTEDVLLTQGQSLLHPRKTRRALMVSEHGYYFPYYNGLVTDQYITRWRNGSDAFSFAGVARRDGEKVMGEEWLKEANALYPGAAAEYEILPDPAAPPPRLR